jgi:hypothetical protein
VYGGIGQGICNGIAGRIEEDERDTANASKAGADDRNHSNRWKISPVLEG